LHYTGFDDYEPFLTLMCYCAKFGSSVSTFLGRIFDRIRKFWDSLSEAVLPKGFYRNTVHLDSELSCAQKKKIHTARQHTK